MESQRVNAKAFKYPEAGFERWIENSLLYTLIRESGIFPAEAVLTAIDEEDYSQYFVIKHKEDVKVKRQEQLFDDTNAGDDDTSRDRNNNNNNSSRKKTTTTTTTTTTTHNNNNNNNIIQAADISYAQLTALLALAGEEWPSSSEVPERLCNAISKEVIKYANRNNLDREQELKELLNPLMEYAQGRGRKQMLMMMPWFAALTVSAVNPLAFYATYMSMLATQSENLNKGDRADRNAIDMSQMGNRHANVEKASLLDEDYYDDDDDDDEYDNDNDN